MSMQSTVQLSETIQGMDTEIVINTYSDRILILITQLGKVGNLIQASIPSTVTQLVSPNEGYDYDYDYDINTSNELNKPDSGGASTVVTDSDLPQPSPAIQLTNLLGIAPSEHLQTLHSLYVSYAATLTWLAEEAYGRQRVPVVVGVALKKVAQGEERPVFLEVMRHLKRLLITRYPSNST